MNTVTPVTLRLPDGSERELRFTLGARKRINQSFGMGMKEAIDSFDSGAFPQILHALMHNAEGNPPDVSVAWLEENLPADATNEILAAILSSATQGKTPPKQIEDLLRVAQQNQIGLISGPSAPKSSESQAASSGGDSLNVKSTPELNGTSASSENTESLLEP